MNWLLNLLKIPKTSVQVFEGMGRGIRAERDFKDGDIVEETPVVVVDPEESKRLNQCILNLYRFGWGPEATCLALGIGSLFNHSKDHNIGYGPNFLKKTMIFRATRDIRKGEQLFINYGYDAISSFKNYLREKSELQEKAEIEKMGAVVVHDAVTLGFSEDESA